MSSFSLHGLRISKRIGISLAALLIIFFLSMQGLGLAHEYYLRVLNALIMLPAMAWGIIQYRKYLDQENYGSFFDLYKICLRIAFIGISLFSVFLLVYLDFIDPDFMQSIAKLESPIPYLSPVMATAIVFFEGMGSALVFSYLIIQLFKKPSGVLKAEKA